VTNPIKGGCLCGLVRYELDPEGILLFNTCYCENCQKNSGTGYTTQLQIEPNAFQWDAGEEEISRYESSPGINRAFCSRCGSRLPQQNLNGVVSVPTGTLDADPGVTPEINIYTDSKRRWATIDGSIESLPGQGSPEFWEKFMQSKSRDA
jgi:hypothetical protein